MHDIAGYEYSEDNTYTSFWNKIACCASISTSDASLAVVDPILVISNTAETKNEQRKVDDDVGLGCRSTSAEPPSSSTASNSPWKKSSQQGSGLTSTLPHFSRAVTKEALILISDGQDDEDSIDDEGDGEDSEYIEDDDEGTNDESGATEQDEDLVDATHDDEVHADDQFRVDDEPFFGVEDGFGVEDTD
ncbi:hypothetical protein Pfo_020459 [Paulownia fortunei]|nr:hypothetical protein Pfo_020459 [Paulownia fortunei]